MDFFAHGFWSYILFHQKKKWPLAVLFGLMPDLLSWFIFFFYRLFTGPLWEGPHSFTVPNWVQSLYNLSHSVIILALVFLVIYLVFRKIPFYILAWPIHILIDITTHSREFLPTPFLWPLSNWHFPGISWGTKWFMILNYTLIITTMIFIFYQKKKFKPQHL